MSDYEEIQSKLFSFILNEWTRTDHRQLVEVDLVFAPGHSFRDEKIRSWVRADQPDLFGEAKNIETFVREILEIARSEADAKPPGKYRFVVRCLQHGGSRPMHSFALAPSYFGSGDEALVPTGGGGGAGGGGARDQQVLASHANQLMRVNAQLFDGTIRVLSEQNRMLNQQVTQMITDNAALRHELDEARSIREDREFQRALAAQKGQRTEQGFQQLMQIGTLIAGKIAGGIGGMAGGIGGMAGGTDGGPEGSQHPSMTPLGMMLGGFFKTIRVEQKEAIVQVLDMPQKMMFLEIYNAVKPPE